MPRAGRVAGVIAGGLLLILALADVSRALDVDGGALVNWSCLNLRIGFCVCGGFPPKPCLRVSYNEPRLLIHTWASPSAKPSPATALQFHEATAAPFPLTPFRAVFSFPCSTDLSDPSSWAAPLTGLASLGAHYSSLLDVVAWRTGAPEAWAVESIAGSLSASLGACAFGALAGSFVGLTIPGLGEVCMGNWGPLFARTGWLVHQTESVGSAAAAYRAAHILSHPELLAGHVVPWPAGDFRASAADLMQLGFPRLTHCFRPGTPPITWEHATTSPVGQYVWVYWVRRSCCVSPARLAGALTGTPERNGGPLVAARGAGPREPGGACFTEPLGLSLISGGRAS